MKLITAWQARSTASEVISVIDKLLDEHTVGQIASLLNERGYRSSEGLEFTSRLVARLCRDHRLKNRHDRLREAGKLILAEIAEKLGISTATVKIWRHHRLVRGHRYNERNGYLYDPPDQAAPTKQQGQKLSERRRFPEVVSHRTNEVQHAT